MKKAISLSAATLLLLLSGCGDPGVKKDVKPNTSAPPAGSIEAPDKKYKDALKKADGEAAKAAAPPAGAPK